MSFTLQYTKAAEKDFARHLKSGDKKILIKINALLDELREHPTTGTGQPEQLRYRDVPTWSRRISEKHRLVYQIEDTVVTVLVLSAWGHYDDN